MPDVAVPETPVVEQIDYTVYLKQISEDLAYIRSGMEDDPEEVPVYQDQLKSIDALLKDLKADITDSSTNVPESEQLTAISETLQRMEQHSQSIDNSSIYSLIGLGLIMGLICYLIFSQFTHM